jgi:hypothetical protein
MNRQDTNQEDQKIDDQLANFLYLHQAYKHTKQEVIQCKKNFYAWEIMPSTWETMSSLQPPWFWKQNQDLPSFI